MWKALQDPSGWLVRTPLLGNLVGAYSDSDVASYTGRMDQDQHGQ